MSDDVVPQVRSSPYMSPAQQIGAQGVLALTNPENEIYKMELVFRSMIIDEHGEPQKKGEPLLNDKGISAVIGTVQSVVSQITVMSNVNEREVNMLMMSLSDALIRELMVNRVNYEIRSLSTSSKILHIAKTSAFLCLKRGYMEGEKRFLKGSQQEIRTEVVGQQKRFSLNPWSAK